jgi:hypothetical protein
MAALGRLRAFLYKPPLIDLTVTDDAGRQTTWRLLPRVAEDGFLLEPFLETQSDFAAYMRGHERKWLRSLRLEVPANQQEFWSAIWSRPEVRLFSLSGLAVSPELPFQYLIDEGVTNVAPATIKTNIPLNTFSVSSGKALLVHAPGEMAFVLPNGVNQLTGSFGINDGAYRNGCRTDGVDFVVEVVGAGGSGNILLHRYLDPLNKTGDRGSQPFRIALPINRPAQLVFRTLPGPKNNSNWDWSYWANLRFTTEAAQ